MQRAISSAPSAWTFRRSRATRQRPCSVAPKRAAALASALSPITNAGAHWIGSASLLVTNENGNVYWRALDCITTCKVLKGPAGALEPKGGRPMAGVVELSGDGGTYHLQLQGERGS